MPTTTKGFPYPSASDNVDIPGDMQALAEAIDTYIPSAFGDVTLNGVQTLTNKTLTSATLSGATQEVLSVVGTGFAGYTFNAATTSVVLITANSTANGTLNIRGDASNTLNSILAVGESVTVVLVITNGATPYYPTAYQIDGSAVTPKWQGGTAPTGGNANSIDVYSLTIMKTAATPTYTVLASQAKFA